VVGLVDDRPGAADLVSVTVGWAELLRQPPVVVTVAEAVPDPVGGGPARRRFGPDGDPEAFLADLVATQLASGGRPPATFVVYDPVSPASGARAYLVERPTLLAVVGAAPRPGPRRPAFGPGTAAILRRSPDPVLVVPLDPHAA
jgi:hypothetical protein